ncbi:hypothetical protein [Streptomyces phaeochromogenes]|uniref:hypothetical protein n=1 Tax=Streptomyces phaeochromogenes TaxID=1923 RepID=UPI00386DAA40|nr:hypothetical protein OHB08_42465 [Streptomyces phaeochromogenes]
MKLAEGMARARLTADAPGLTMAYYADLLHTDPPLERQSPEGGLTFDDLTGHQRELAALWLAAAGVPEPEELQNIGLAPLRQMIGWLVEDRTGRIGQRLRERTVRRLERLLVALLREVETYTTSSERRAQVRERVAGVIRRERPRVVVAHSLGSVVAYETLHAHPELAVEQLVTLGSPLGLPTLTRRLEPAVRGGRGARPPGVGHWTNIADVGDLVAIPPKLSKVFPVDQDVSFDNGLDFHGFGAYLANGLTSLAIAPYVS